MKKKCFKCGVKKDLELFYRHPMMADGHLNKCKTCAKKDVKANYRKRVDQYREYDKKRSLEPGRREAALRYQEERRAMFPGKERARSSVSSAMRNGKLTRQPCRVCGSKKSEAHHRDYRKPFDVDWLCMLHHRMEHERSIYCQPKGTP